MPIYREDLNPERINLLGQRVLGVIGGNSMARELLPRNAASPKLMLINPPQEIAPSPQVCLCRYDFREQFRKSYEFAMRRNMPEIVRLVTDPSYHVPDLEAQASLVQFDLPKLDQTEPAIETGRRMANELFAKGSTSDCFCVFGAGNQSDRRTADSGKCLAVVPPHRSHGLTGHRFRTDQDRS